MGKKFWGRPWLEEQIWGFSRCRLLKPESRQESSGNNEAWDKTLYDNKPRKLPVSQDDSNDPKGRGWKFPEGGINNAKSNCNPWECLELQSWGKEVSKERETEDQIERELGSRKGTQDTLTRWKIILYF